MDEPSLLLRFTLVLAVIGLAWVSWRLVERPARRDKTVSRNKVFALSGTALAGAAAFGVWTSRLDLDSEYLLARAMVDAPAPIYGWDADERLTVKYRLALETSTPDAIVLGSSRVMLVGQRTYPRRILNLAVSGASLEDLIAIAYLAIPRVNPRAVLLGADPWLFNADAGQGRWITLREEVRAASAALTAPQSEDSSDLQGFSRTPLLPTGVGARVYRAINRHRVRALDDAPEMRAKVRRDGSRVYSLSALQRTPAEVEAMAPSAVKYSMAPFTYSDSARALFERLVERLALSRKVTLVLTPYHPAAYRRMSGPDGVLTGIEEGFLAIARRRGVAVVGSYDPSRVGCTADEFIDGMHPTDNCMKKVLVTGRR